MLIRVLSAAIVLVVVSPSSTLAQGRGTASRPTPSTIEQRLVDLLIQHGAKQDFPTFGGVFQSADDRVQLVVTSARTMIAANAFKAAQTRARYTPPASARQDLVFVTCGDTTFGETFECSSVRITTGAGRVLQPLTYRAGPEVLRNALGARWTVRTVEATYRARDLTGPFLITFASFDGLEWSRQIDQREFDEELLLGEPARWNYRARTMEANASPAATPAPEPSKPVPTPLPPSPAGLPELRVSITAHGAGWDVQYLSEYRFIGCNMQIGNSVAFIQGFEKGKKQTVTVSAFRPTVRLFADLTGVAVWCGYGGQRVNATIVP